MRKEGRKQGMTLSFSPACEQRSLRRRLLPGGGAAESPPGKPSNRGKISAKSRDKCKGANKARALDVGLNPRLVSWRVVSPSGCGGQWSFSVGESASAAAVYLSGDPLWNRWDPHNREEKEEEEGREQDQTAAMEEKEQEELELAGDDGEAEEEGKEEKEEAEDDVIGFYEVWGTWEYIDDDDWCVVGEMET